MIYVTLDADGHRISENAAIYAFPDKGAALRWALSHFNSEWWNTRKADLHAGRFGDCWIKTSTHPGDLNLGPFTLENVIVEEPGKHPGGRQYWVTPSDEVYVLVGAEERT